MDSNKFFHLFLFLTVAFAMASCEEDRLEPGVPAFIKIEHIDLETNYQLQGTNSHKITDVWVYADDQSVGVFELPAVVPVLKNGNAKLRLEAGIKLNGITTTRSNSPFFEPVILDPFNFIPDSIVLINPTVTYRPTTEFVWLEDFEGSTISIDTVNLLSSVNIEKTEMGSAFEGNYSGVINLTSENNTFEAASFEAFVLPTGGRPVFLELNYKNDYNFSVGIFAQSSGEIIKKEIIFLVPQENWNKIYINLTDKLSDSPNATDFKIFFRTVLSEQHESAEIYLDNIKVMYR
jgi:hypothetical protein